MQTYKVVINTVLVVESDTAKSRCVRKHVESFAWLVLCVFYLFTPESAALARGLRYLRKTRSQTRLTSPPSFVWCGGLHDWLRRARVPISLISKTGAFLCIVQDPAL